MQRKFYIIHKYTIFKTDFNILCTDILPTMSLSIHIIVKKEFLLINFPSQGCQNYKKEIINKLYLSLLDVKVFMSHMGLTVDSYRPFLTQTHRHSFPLWETQNICWIFEMLPSMP